MEEGSGGPYRRIPLHQACLIDFLEKPGESSDALPHVTSSLPRWEGRVRINS